MTRAVVLVLAVAGSVAAFASDTPPALDVVALVRQLGSEDFAEREAAEKQLAALKVEEVPPELLAALKSPKAEVRERAARIVATLRKRIELAALPRGERFAKNGQFDLYVAAGYVLAPASDLPPPRAITEVQRLCRDEQFVSRGEVDLFVASTAAINLRPEDERLWGPATKFGVRAVTAALMSEHRKPRLDPTWFGDYPKFCKYMNPSSYIRTDDEYLRPAKHPKHQATVCHEVIQSAGVSAEGSLQGLIVSRGPVTAKHSISESLIYANGDIRASSVGNSVIICDGDVVLERGASRSLIIARGKIIIKSGSDACTLISTREVKPGKVPVIQYPPPPNPNDPDDIRRWGLEAASAEQFRVIAKEKDTNPLGFITFFELHRVGLEVKPADKAVTVAKVAPKSAGEKAGLKVGDVVLDVGGKMPTDAESLRRLLRDALALGDASLKVRRGETTELIKVALPD